MAPLQQAVAGVTLTVTCVQAGSFVIVYVVTLLATLADTVNTNTKQCVFLRQSIKLFYYIDILNKKKKLDLIYIEKSRSIPGNIVKGECAIGAVRSTPTRNERLQTYNTFSGPQATIQTGAALHSQH